MNSRAYQASQYHSFAQFYGELASKNTQRETNSVKPMSLSLKPNSSASNLFESLNFAALDRLEKLLDMGGSTVGHQKVCKRASRTDSSAARTLQLL